MSASFSSQPVLVAGKDLALPVEYGLARAAPLALEVTVNALGTAAASVHGIRNRASANWYIDTFESVSKWQRTKQTHVEILELCPGLQPTRRHGRLAVARKNDKVKGEIRRRRWRRRRPPSTHAAT